MFAQTEIVCFFLSNNVAFDACCVVGADAQRCVLSQKQYCYAQTVATFGIVESTIEIVLSLSPRRFLSYDRICVCTNLVLPGIRVPTMRCAHPSALISLANIRNVVNWCRDVCLTMAELIQGGLLISIQIILFSLA